MSWIKDIQTPRIKLKGQKADIPSGLWLNCIRCHSIFHKDDLTKNLQVCPKCNYHFRMGARARIRSLIDRGTFKEFGRKLSSPNPLNFVDQISYEERLLRSEKKTNFKDAIVTGSGLINQRKVFMGAFEFAFMGGSMGLVVGEKIVRLFEKATEENVPVIIVSSSGGARMQ